MCFKIGFFFISLAQLTKTTHREIKFINKTCVINIKSLYTSEVYYFILF